MGFPKESDISGPISNAGATSTKPATNPAHPDTLSDFARSGAVNSGASLPTADTAPYSLNPGNWYKSIPYAMRAVYAGAAVPGPSVFFFPVNP